MEQVEKERGLHLSVANVMSEIGVPVYRHQQMRLQRESLACGPGLALNHHTAIFDPVCDKSL